MSDQFLVERLRAGDTDALGQLVRRYQDRIYNTVWRVCGHADDAADLTQEAFLKAFQAVDNFRGQSSFFTWLYRIAVNLALSHRRTKKRRFSHSLDGSSAAEMSEEQRAVMRGNPGRGRNPLNRSDDTEMHGHVAEALAQLDEEFRAVVVLRDVEELDYRQIGEILDLPPGTVKSRLHRGRVALRKMLEPLLPEQQ